MVHKVAAYIFRSNPQQPGQNELLVFAHRDMPEVPLQVPGGTVDTGEDFTTALFREIEEESGLTGLQLLRELGHYRRYWQDIAQEEERHFFLLQASADTPDAWEYEVAGAGIDCGLVFSYRWVKVSGELQLAGKLGEFLTPAYAPELFILEPTACQSPAASVQTPGTALPGE